MEQFSPQAAEIIKAIRLLPLEEQRRIAEEVLRQIEEQHEAHNKEERRQAILALAGSWKYIAEENTDDMLEEIRQHRKQVNSNQTDWTDNHAPNSLLSPEDEKNVQRIWKSPGGC